MKIATVIGVRPEIIKMSLLIPLLDKDFEQTLIFSGQHYSPNMVDVFFDELDVRRPDFHLPVNSSDYNLLISAIKDKLAEVSPNYVIVYGDSNTAYAGAKAASSLGIKLVHVEAGLRSFDESMPEERNRIAADRMSSVLFSPTELAKRFLNEEGIEEKIFIVGNTIVDAVNHFSGRAKESGILEELDLDSEEYILATVHRQENVDTKENLVKFVKAFEQINKKIIFPIHPRTTKKLKDFGLVFSHNVRLINPVGYFDFLHLMQNAALVMTDSGGVQEEAIVLNVPCLTLRNTTERWETIEAGGNLLAGLDPLLISYYAKMIIETDFSKKMRLAKNPYGDGTTSEKIAKILQDVE